MTKRCHVEFDFSARRGNGLLPDYTAECAAGFKKMSKRKQKEPADNEMVPK